MNGRVVENVQHSFAAFSVNFVTWNFTYIKSAFKDFFVLCFKTTFNKLRIVQSLLVTAYGASDALNESMLFCHRRRPLKRMFVKWWSEIWNVLKNVFWKIHLQMKLIKFDPICMTHRVKIPSNRLHHTSTCPSNLFNRLTYYIDIDLPSFLDKAVTSSSAPPSVSMPFHLSFHWCDSERKGEKEKKRKKIVSQLKSKTKVRKKTLRNSNEREKFVLMAQRKYFHEV